MKFKLRRYYLYYLGRLLAFKVYLLPIKVGVFFGAALGGIAFHILGKYRRTALDNLKLAFGSQKPDPEIRAIAKRVFENLGRNAVELVNFPKLNSVNIDKFVRIENRKILDGELAKGNGVIILTAHFGNWELLAMTLIAKGYKGSVIGRRIYFDRYDKFLNYLRKVKDVNVIYRDDSPKKMLRVLKDNDIIGMLADQDVDSVDGVFVKFFGRETYTPVGPVALAKASGASMVPAFIVREGSRHVLKIEKPVEMSDTGDKEKDLVINTQKWSDIVERFIKQYPDQWVWMHRRWKTKPVQENR